MVGDARIGGPQLDRSDPARRVELDRNHKVAKSIAAAGRQRVRRAFEHEVGRTELPAVDEFRRRGQVGFIPRGAPAAAQAASV